MAQDEVPHDAVAISASLELCRSDSDARSGSRADETWAMVALFGGLASSAFDVFTRNWPAAVEAAMMNRIAPQQDRDSNWSEDSRVIPSN